MYHFGYHDSDIGPCPVCAEHAEVEGEQEAIARAEVGAERRAIKRLVASAKDAANHLYVLEDSFREDDMTDVADDCFASRDALARAVKDLETLCDEEASRGGAA